MHENTRAYVSTDNLPHMHKIVLQTPKGVTLTALSEQLRGVTEPDMPTHYLWTEQPENVPTCLAIAPILIAVLDADSKEMYIAT